MQHKGGGSSCSLSARQQVMGASSNCKKRGRSSPPSMTVGPYACCCSRPALCSCGYFGVSFNALITPDFEELASQFPDFRKAWKEVEESRDRAKQKGGSSSFAASLTHSFSASLTKALLHLHFHVSLPTIPDNHLCPPVPNRFFYVRWIQTELLPLLKPDNIHAPPCFVNMQQEQFSGIMLDIGTGASCIYPLLFAASHRQDNHQHTQYLRAFFATEIDPESVDLARQNVQGNPALHSVVHIVQVPPLSEQPQHNQYGPLQCSLDHLPPDARSVDVCMTNPPFYDSENPNEMSQIRVDGRQRTAMTVSEGSYPGGEVGFVWDMFCDSFRAYLSTSTVSSSDSHLPIRPPPRWCSSMIGKKASFTLLKNAMEQLLGYSHVRSTEFDPGHMTRWFLAWTFLRPHIRSPLAHTDSWSFNVDLGMTIFCNENHMLHEVSSRVHVYCEGSVQGRQLKIQWNEQQRIALIEEQHEALNSSVWFGDDALPHRLQHMLKDHVSPEQRRSFLPQEGHFQIEVSIRSINERIVVVTAHAFSHTRYGKMTVEKLKQQMEGDVCRTNRKWRRKYQRSRQANEGSGETMILS